MNPLISVSGVSFSYGQVKVLENISFNVEQDDFIAVIGPNGSGKTTLMKILLGFLRPQSGTANVALPTNRIGYVPQYHTIDTNFPGTVREILSDHTVGARQAGITNLLSKKFVSLSGGQQQRVLIALALERNPRLLILDEPTAGVDIQAQEAFYDLLRKLNKQGITILLVTHEIGVIPNLVKTVLCLNRTICCMGAPKKVPELLKEMYGPHFLHHHHKHHHD